MYPHGYPHLSAQEVAQLQKTENFKVVLFKSQENLKSTYFQIKKDYKNSHKNHAVYRSVYPFKPGQTLDIEAQ